jgi:MEMO1 family protein
MPINFAALVPHPPISIPTIGKDKNDLVKNTIESLTRLGELIYQSKIETLIIISGHGQVMDNAFSINHSPILETDLSNFGDLGKYPSYKNDIGLAYQIREYIETKLPLSLYSDNKLDYGSSIPLFHILSQHHNVKIIPVTTSELNYEKHVQLGEHIKEICFRSSERIGIIASADLSHRLSEDSPAGFSPQGKEFDSLVIDSLKDKKFNQLINISNDLVKEAGTCSLRPILILLGVIKNMNFETEVLSYENPLGVGHLTINFNLK